MVGGSSAESRLFSGRTCPSGASTNCSEYDRLVAIKQNSAFHMPAYGPRQHYFFEVTALSDEILHRIAMRHPHHILFNDGPIIEYFSDVVAGGADQLYPTLKSLMVRPRTHESGQERVVNIDNPLRITVYKIVGQDLHIARQHHEIRIVLGNEGMNAALGFAFVVFADWH